MALCALRTFAVAFKIHCKNAKNAKGRKKCVESDIITGHRFAGCIPYPFLLSFALNSDMPVRCLFASMIVIIHSRKQRGGRKEINLSAEIQPRLFEVWFAV
jgi:hypothetical protein